PEDKKDWKVSDNKAWSGSPSEPRVGDLRVSFYQAKPGPVSIVAVQKDNTFEPYQARAGGNTIEMLKTGTHSADEMFKAAMEQNNVFTWILRFVGWLVMFIGLSMIFSPIQTFGSVIPFVGDILGMGTGIFAFVIASTLSLITCAIAWVAYRPLLGIGMLAVAGGIFFVMKHHGANRAAA
ncbi:MAG: TMEM43 family protein, partial [Candidatus Xenobia bacterium]